MEQIHDRRDKDAWYQHRKALLNQVFERNGALKHGLENLQQPVAEHVLKELRSARSSSSSSDNNSSSRRRSSSSGSSSSSYSDLVISSY